MGRQVMRITGFSCTPLHQDNETTATREQRIARVLVAKFGKREAYRHAENMHKLEAYEKQGINYREVLKELDNLTQKKPRKR